MFIIRDSLKFINFMFLWNKWIIVFVYFDGFVYVIEEICKKGWEIV